MYRRAFTGALFLAQALIAVAPAQQGPRPPPAAPIPPVDAKFRTLEYRRGEHRDPATDRDSLRLGMDELDQDFQDAGEGAAATERPTRPEWPNVPAGQTDAHLGLTGLWEARTTVPGLGEVREVYRISLEEDSVRVDPVDAGRLHSPRFQDRKDPLDRFSSKLVTFKLWVLKARDLELRAEYSGGTMILHWDSWNSMSGQYLQGSEVDRSLAAKKGKPAAPCPTVWTRRAPLVHLVEVVERDGTAPPVLRVTLPAPNKKEESRESRFQVRIRGEHLPSFADYPAAVRFSDGGLESRPQIHSPKELLLDVIVAPGVKSGRKDAVILGYVFPGLLEVVVSEEEYCASVAKGIRALEDEVQDLRIAILRAGEIEREIGRMLVPWREAAARAPAPEAELRAMAAAIETGTRSKLTELFPSRRIPELVSQYFDASTLGRGISPWTRATDHGSLETMIGAKREELGKLQSLLEERYPPLQAGPAKQLLDKLMQEDLRRNALEPIPLDVFPAPPAPVGHGDVFPVPAPWYPARSDERAAWRSVNHGAFAAAIEFPERSPSNAVLRHPLTPKEEGELEHMELLPVLDEEDRDEVRTAGAVGRAREAAQAIWRDAQIVRRYHALAESCRPGHSPAYVELAGDVVRTLEGIRGRYRELRTGLRTLLTARDRGRAAAHAKHLDCVARKDPDLVRLNQELTRLEGESFDRARKALLDQIATSEAEIDAWWRDLDAAFRAPEKAALGYTRTFDEVLRLGKDYATPKLDWLVWLTEWAELVKSVFDLMKLLGKGGLKLWRELRPEDLAKHADEAAKVEKALEKSLTKIEPEMVDKARKIWAGDPGGAKKADDYLKELQRMGLSKDQIQKVLDTATVPGKAREYVDVVKKSLADFRDGFPGDVFVRSIGSGAKVDELLSGATKLPDPDIWKIRKNDWDVSIFVPNDTARDVVKMLEKKGRLGEYMGKFGYKPGTKLDEIPQADALRRSIAETYAADEITRLIKKNNDRIPPAAYDNQWFPGKATRGDYADEIHHIRRMNEVGGDAFFTTGGKKMIDLYGDELQYTKLVKNPEKAGAPVVHGRTDKVPSEVRADVRFEQADGADILTEMQTFFTNLEDKAGNNISKYYIRGALGRMATHPKLSKTLARDFNRAAGEPEERILAMVKKLQESDDPGVAKLFSSDEVKNLQIATDMKYGRYKPGARADSDLKSRMATDMKRWYGEASALDAKLPLAENERRLRDLTRRVRMGAVKDREKLVDRFMPRPDPGDYPSKSAHDAAKKNWQQEAGWIADIKNSDPMVKWASEGGLGHPPLSPILKRAARELKGPSRALHRGSSMARKGLEVPGTGNALLEKLRDSGASNREIAGMLGTMGAEGDERDLAIIHREPPPPNRSDLSYILEVVNDPKADFLQEMPQRDEIRSRLRASPLRIPGAEGLQETLGLYRARLAWASWHCAKSPFSFVAKSFRQTYRWWVMSAGDEVYHDQLIADLGAGADKILMGLNLYYPGNPVRTAMNSKPDLVLVGLAEDDLKKTLADFEEALAGAMARTDGSTKEKAARKKALGEILAEYRGWQRRQLRDLDTRLAGRLEHIEQRLEAVEAMQKELGAAMVQVSQLLIATNRVQKTVSGGMRWKDYPNLKLASAPAVYAPLSGVIAWCRAFRTRLRIGTASGLAWDLDARSPVGMAARARPPQR